MKHVLQLIPAPHVDYTDWSPNASSVPYIVLEGRRRDFTLEGAKEVDDYLKEFDKVVKESK